MLVSWVFINGKERVATGKLPAKSTIITKFKLDTPQGYSIPAKLTIVLIIVPFYKQNLYRNQFDSQFCINLD